MTELVDGTRRLSLDDGAGLEITNYHSPKTTFGLATLSEEADANGEVPTVEVTYDAESEITSNIIKSPATEHDVPPTPERRRSSISGHRKRSSIASLSALNIPPSPHQRQGSIASVTDDEFGDFEEGQEFGDFEDYTDDTAIKFPDLSNEKEFNAYMTTVIDNLFDIPNPPEPKTPGEELDSVDEEESPFMLTDRAISLWRQLTALPPMQPPDWKRSRIRRLFLVSLGIPVDLDEILPKMTHKKLVLPSTKDKNQSLQERRSRRKLPDPPPFEISIAQQECSKSREALEAMDERELRIHYNNLQAHTVAASRLLTYWLEQRDVAKEEKETFEAVVGNLVKFHKRQQDEQQEKLTTKKKNRFSLRS